MLSELSLDSINIEMTAAYERGRPDSMTITLNLQKSRELYNNISNIQFTKKEKYEKQFDSLFQIKFLNDNESIGEILILGQNAIVYEGFIYKSFNTMIDIENIRAIFDSAVN